MKKVLLVITLLFSFFLSPIKADSYETYPYFYAYSNVDLSSLGMGTNQTVSASWFFDPLENGLMLYSPTLRQITNMSNSQINGWVIIDIGTPSNPITARGDFIWSSGYTTAYVTYMGITFYVDDFQVASTGNQFKWYEENPSTEVDLTTIQNYMLVICVLLFMNFLRGR